MPRRAAHEPVAFVAVDRLRTVYQRPAEPDREADGARSQVLPSVGLALLLAAAVWALQFGLRSDALRIKDVAISGATPDLVMTVADLVVPGCVVVGGQVRCQESELGPNELLFNSADVAQQIEALPAVKSVSVRALMPNRLTISIVQRTPVAAWVVGSKIFRVGDDGVVIDEGSPQGLPVVIGQVGGDPVKPGDRIDPQLIAGAARLQTELAGQLGVPVKRIQYSPADGLAIIGDGDMIAMFGQPVDLPVKMAELQRIVQLASDKKLSLAFVDLRYKTPFYRTR